MTPGRALDPEVREADPYSVAPTALVDAGGLRPRRLASGAEAVQRSSWIFVGAPHCREVHVLPRRLGTWCCCSLFASLRGYIHNYYAHNQSFLHGLPCSVTPLLTVQLLS